MPRSKFGWRSGIVVAKSLQATGGPNVLYLLDLGGVAGQATPTRNADIRLPGDIVIMSKAGAPTGGGSGDGAAFAGPGSLLIDTTNKDFYINVDTKASPQWNKVTRAT